MWPDRPSERRTVYLHDTIIMCFPEPKRGDPRPSLHSLDTASRAPTGTRSSSHIYCHEMLNQGSPTFNRTHLFPRQLIITYLFVLHAHIRTSGKQQQPRRAHESDLQAPRACHTYNEQTHTHKPNTRSLFQTCSNIPELCDVGFTGCSYTQRNSWVHPSVYVLALNHILFPWAYQHTVTGSS